MPGRGPESRTSGASTVHERVGLLALFSILCAFTLTTWDGDELAPRLISVALFLLLAIFLSQPAKRTLLFGVPAICLLLATVYGVVQTLFFPQKIIADGWTGVLFWFAAAAITCLATQVFRTSRAASEFRLYFIIFGTAVCVLDLLEQASQTNKYLWLVPSRYHSVFGPFAYWNNFAQFVELLLPVTLWRALSGRRSGVQFLVCAAVQAGAVVASGSRAGTILVIVELFAVLALAFGRNPNRTLLLGAGLAVVFSVLFIYAAGYETVIAKLQQSDQLTVRRNIDKSSLAMIRAHPLTGWGLDTYVSVYRQFARYDDGTYVNRAHNDWLQWAAEGGVFFFGIVLVMIGWSIRPAIHSVWGLGLIALAIHALVDYPFARLGVCGWYFCLLGMLVAAQRNGSVQPPKPKLPDASKFGLRPA